jgi:uncharacterized protein YuzE
MTLTYDLGHDVAYLRLAVPGPRVETRRLTDDVYVDVAPDGTVYGIELLHASAQLRAADAGMLVVADTARGVEHVLPLA